MSKAARLVGPLLVVTGATGFSFKAIFIKLVYAGWPVVDPATLLALRMLFSAPLFALMALAVRASGAPLTRRDWGMLALMGFVGYYLSSYLDFLGLLYISAGLERLILFLQPTMVVLISALLLGQRVRRHHVVSLALSYCGIALVVAASVQVSQDPHDILLGAGLVFLSAACFACYTVGSGELIPRLGATRFVAYASLAATGFVVGQFFLTHDASALVLPAPVYGLSLAMAIVSTVLPAWLVSEGVRRIGASQTSMISAIGPVVTIFLGWLILGEVVTAVQILGAAMVLAGVLLVSLKVEPAARR